MRRIISILTIIAFTAFPVSGFAGAEPGPDPEAVPDTLKMVLDPGKKNGMTIFFKPKEGASRVPGVEAQETAEPAAPPGDTPGGAGADMVPDLEVPEQVEPGTDGAETLALDNTEDAGAANALASIYKNRVSPNFTLTTGYRNDYLYFTIPGANNSPNVISELDWDNMHSVEVTGIYRWTGPSGFHIKAGGAAAYTVTGDHRDSDYAGDDKTLEYSRSHSDIDGSTMFDGTLGLGYRMDLLAGKRDTQFSLIPLVGYSYHVQHMRMHSSYYSINPSDYTLAGHNSFYEAVWQGPWIGIEADLAFSGRHGIQASLEYHWADYEAEADWNLRSDLAHPLSFTQEADGEGYMASFSYWYKPHPRWEWLLGLAYKDMDTGSGSRVHYWADGTSTGYGFHGAEWRSWSLNFGFKYYF